MERKRKYNNGVAKADIFKVDRSPETIRKAREMFKELEDIKVPYSGVEMLEMIRKEKRLP